MLLFIFIALSVIFLLGIGKLSDSPIKREKRKEKEEKEREQAQILAEKNSPLINEQFIGFMEKHLEAIENNKTPCPFFEERFADKCLRIIIEKEMPELNKLLKPQEYSIRFNKLWRLLYYYASVRMKELDDKGFLTYTRKEDGEKHKYQIEEPFSSFR